MLNPSFKTPLIAAFFCGAILADCQPHQSDSENTFTQCASEATPIASVQGDGVESPLLGRSVTVQGIVTLVENGRGLYLEEPGTVYLNKIVE